MATLNEHFPYVSILSAGLGAALGASVHLPSSLGPYTPAILAGAGAFFGYRAGCVIERVLRRQEIGSQQQLAHLGRIIFVALGILCFIMTIANLRRFANGAGLETLSAAVMTASFTSGLLIFPFIPPISIKPAMLFLGTFNVGLAVPALYVLAKRPSLLSVVAAVWCLVVAILLPLTHLTTLKSLLRFWNRSP